MAISDTLNIPLARMFKPYWRSIGPTAVKDLQSRPQTAQLVADLLRISVPDLLLSIQADVLPWLVLTKSKEVILRIAQARGDSDPGKVCLEGTNKGPIIALLLVQNVPDLENFITSLFRDVSSLFDGFEFVDLLKIQPMPTAVELLKNAGEEDESRRSRVLYTVQIRYTVVTNSA
jgi:serine/threonine-protein kinase ATR